MKSGLQTSESVSLAAAEAIRKASASLLKKQTAEGFWWADLRADSTLESDYVLMELWLHPPINGVWNPPTRPQIDRAVASWDAGGAGRSASSQFSLSCLCTQHRRPRAFSSGVGG